MYAMFDIQTSPVLLHYYTTRWQDTLGNTFKTQLMLKYCCLPQDGIIECVYSPFKCYLYTKIF